MRNFITFLLTICLGCSFEYAAAQGAQATPDNSPVKWYSIEAADSLRSKTPKKLFIDVYTDWCGWCKVMDKNTFTDSKVANYLNRHFYSVKLNAEQKTPIKFDGHTFTFMPEYRSHELAIALLQGQMSYPNIVYVDEQGQPIQAVPGYQTPEAILPILVFFAENHYTKLSWEDYSTTVWPTHSMNRN
jgi:thioredoxin-related protein